MGTLPKLFGVLEVVKELEDLLLEIKITEDSYSSPEFNGSPEGQKMRKSSSLLGKCWSKLDEIDMLSVKQKYRLTKEKISLAQTQVSETRKSLRSLRKKHVSGEAMLDELFIAKGEILVSVTNLKPYYDQIIYLKRYINKKINRCEDVHTKLTVFAITDDDKILKVVQKAFFTLDHKKTQVKCQLKFFRRLVTESLMDCLILDVIYTLN